MDNDMLFPEDYGDAKLLALIASSGLQLIEWGSLALPRCSDNVEAETYGAELALRLYEQYVRKCSEFEVPPLPLDRIQGDIKPLIMHLQFQSRFRRKDLIPIIDRWVGGWGPRYLVYKRERGPVRVPSSLTEDELMGVR